MPFVFLRGDVGIAPYITFGKLFCEVRTPKGRPLQNVSANIHGFAGGRRPPTKAPKNSPKILHSHFKYGIIVMF